MFRQAIPLLHVSSSDAAEDFYCAKLGFTLVSAYRPDASRRDPCYLVLRRDDALLHVSSFSGDCVAGGVVSIAHDDVDALYAEYRVAGVTVDLPPTDQTWGNREMYVRDADRNTLRFQQRR
jgi:catechol 2,3-dioxygenase-like lactoylglutathione lyase family enzyme